MQYTRESRYEYTHTQHTVETYTHTHIHTHTHTPRERETHTETTHTTNIRKKREDSFICLLNRRTHVHPSAPARAGS
jgi:hypothetical protein